MEYEVKAIQDEASLAQLEEAWTRLLGASPAGTIFSSFPWNMAWWHASEVANAPTVLVASDLAERVCDSPPDVTAERPDA